MIANDLKINSLFQHSFKNLLKRLFWSKLQLKFLSYKKWNVISLFCNFYVQWRFKFHKIIILFIKLGSSLYAVPCCLVHDLFWSYSVYMYMYYKIKHLPIPTLQLMPQWLWDICMYKITSNLPECIYTTAFWICRFSWKNINHMYLHGTFH